MKDDKNNSVDDAAAEAEKAKAEAAEKEKKDAEGGGESPDPLKKELEKVNKNKPRTRKEKIIYKRELLDKELAALEGSDDEDEDDDEVDDDTPVTVGMLKKQDEKKIRNDALSLAEDIEDDTERELVIYHIDNTIKPSGDAQQDFKNARAIVNSRKNAEIAEDAARKGTPNRHGSGSGAPPKKGDGVFEPTADEAVFMRAPYNLSKEQILDARKKIAARNQ